MSLNWSIAGIEDFEELFQTFTDEFGTEQRKLDGMTDAFIWQSMVTGLGKGWALDADFAPEFYARLKMLERLNGAPLAYRPKADGTGVEPWPVTIEDVRRRIGLTVNVSPVSRAQFLKNAVVVDLDRDAKRAARELAPPIAVHKIGR